MTKRHNRVGYDGRPMNQELFTGTEPKLKRPRSSSGMTFTIIRNWIILAVIVSALAAGVYYGHPFIIDSISSN